MKVKRREEWRTSEWSERITRTGTCKSGVHTNGRMEVNITLALVAAP